MIARIGRQETCPACGRDLHCCKGCEFYDPKVYNECHETSADRVLDKEAGNFCDYFSVATRPPQPSAKVDDPRRKLDSLFKKPS